MRAERLGPMSPPALAHVAQRVAGSLRAFPSVLGRPIRAFRRRARLARLRNAPPPGTVLFLCQGNVYRSPYALAVFRASLPAPLRDSILVDSAGFLGSGRPVPSRVVALATSRGFDLGFHRSTLVSTEAIAAANLLVVMEPAQQRALRRRFGERLPEILVLGDLDPEGSGPRAIADPALQSLDRLTECFARIERCASALGRAVTFSAVGDASGPC